MVKLKSYKTYKEAALKRQPLFLNAVQNVGDTNSIKPQSNKIASRVPPAFIRSLDEMKKGAIMER